VHNSFNQHRSSVPLPTRGMAEGPLARRLTSSRATWPIKQKDRCFSVTARLWLGFTINHWQHGDKWLVRPRSWLLRFYRSSPDISEPPSFPNPAVTWGMALDGSGCKDRLFWLCITDKFNGVVVQRSEDRGESWSEPLRLNHSEKADSFTPSIAVNSEGVIGVSWYEIQIRLARPVFHANSIAGKRSCQTLEFRVPLMP